MNNVTFSVKIALNKGRNDGKLKRAACTYVHKNHQTMYLRIQRVRSLKTMRKKETEIRGTYEILFHLHGPRQNAVP